MIKKPDAGVDVRLARAIKREGKANVGFSRAAGDGAGAESGPAQGNEVGRWLLLDG